MPRKRKSAILVLDAPWTDAELQVLIWCYGYVFDFQSRKRMLVLLDTPFDGGMRWPAINPRGDILTVGSYTYGGIACYAADTGELISFGRRKEVQSRVTYSPDGKRLYSAQRAVR